MGIGDYEVARFVWDVRFYRGPVVVDGVHYGETGIYDHSGATGPTEKVWLYAVMGGFPIIVTTDEAGKIDEFIFWDVHGGKGWLRKGREAVKVESPSGVGVTFGSNAKE